jgi:Fe2+ transport system protein B
MIELNDDLLNKYIDDELNRELMQQVKVKLESSHQDMMKYRTLLSVHNELKKMPVEGVSSNFTANLMLKVQRSLKSKKEQNFFIVSVLSLFFLICVGIIGYLIANYIFTAEPNSSDIVTKFTVRSEDFITILHNLFSKGNISIIGSIFSFILLISGYFFYDSIRHSKQQ